MPLPVITVGFVNCNRLSYLKSCVESFEHCSSYPKNLLQFVLVDNASTETGTSEYLDKKQKEGFTVFKKENRDPSNEFATGLNTILSIAEGDFLLPLQGDMQFVLKGPWLENYVKFMLENKEWVSCATLDAARRVTNLARTQCIMVGDSFVVDYAGSIIVGAGDVVYPRWILDRIGKWETNNGSHEGGDDSETKFLKKAYSDPVISKHTKMVYPVTPPAIAIYTDRRGTNARVRGNRRYGDYWEPKSNDGFSYYRVLDTKSTALSEIVANKAAIVVSIEELAQPVGWNAPLDECGNWLKNPIRPETAIASDFVELDHATAAVCSTCGDDDVEEWLKS